MRKNSKIKVLVCGGNGFIGYNVISELIKNKNLIVYATYNKKHKNIKKVKWLKANLLNKKTVDKVVKKKDVVIQAAAITTGSKDVIEKPYVHVTDNIILNTLMLRSIFENKIKHFIFFSCTVMYNSSIKFHSEISRNIVSKESPYYGVANMKMYIEKQSLFYSKLNKTKFSILRHSNIYGPHDKFDENTSHALPNLIKKSIKKGKYLEIWGDGKSVRDFLYVKDLVNCIKLIIKKQKTNFEIFNVGSNKPISITELAKKILKIIDNKKKIKYLKRKFFISNKIKINTKKIKSLGWRPLYSINQGLNKTIDWYKNKI